MSRCRQGSTMAMGSLSRDSTRDSRARSCSCEWHSLSLRGLWDSRICAMTSKGIALQSRSELIPAVSHRLWPWRFVVAVPAAETSGDPGDEGERAWRMSILLPFCLAFEFLRDEFERGCEGIIDDVAGRTRAAVPGIDELAGTNGARQPDGGEIEQALGVDDLAVFEREPVALEGAEGLFDTPAQPIELHNFVSLLGILDGVRGEETPEKGGLARRRIDLARLDQVQLDHCGKAGHKAILRAGDGDLSAAQRDGGGASLVARSARRDANISAAQRLRSTQRFEQSSTRRQAAILSRAHDQIQTRRTVDEQLVNITFPIRHHGHRAGLAQARSSRLTSRQPASRFLSSKGRARRALTGA